MKKINVALVRLLQFVVFVVFTFIVLAYFGTLILIPLDALALLVKLLSVVGLNGVISTVLAIPVVAYLGMIIYKTPGLFPMLLETGMDLVQTGKSRVEAFNEIVESVRK